MSGAAPEGEAKQKSFQQHLAVVTEADVMDPEGLYEFLESMRALCSGLSFFSHVAGTQLESAARRGAKQSKDGRLTVVQKGKLKLVLRKMGRQLGGNVADDLLAAASGAVKTYSLIQEFLDEVESSTIDRPHRRSNGGFNW
jgi:hypothetical protein